MSYVQLYKDGILKKRAYGLKEMLNPCRLCPRECGVKRLEGETGECGAGKHVHISGYGAHFGEESPLVGRGGSGTIFFAFCSLRCVFCQNFEISRGKNNYRISLHDLADIMVKLQERGCENINLVSPSHYVAQIIDALQIAVERGLYIPLVYNSSGYERLETLRRLEGIIDIYLPDIKYADETIARKYSKIDDYPQVAKTALQKMQRQVGDLELNDRGVAQKGVLIRHLVLPGGIAGTKNLMEFIAAEISPSAAINIMDQYYPAYLAHRYPEINRRLRAEEYKEAVESARRASPGFRFF